MTNNQLAEKENQLYSKTIELYKNNSEENLEDIFIAYNQIFKEYVNVAENDIEALKRSLFIQWYSISEPNYLTGISELEKKIEIRLLEILNEKIKANKLDNELVWMLNYYANWDYIYLRFPDFKEVIEFVKNRSEKYFPQKIDKLEMESRGQMEKYWISLNFASH